MWERFRRQWFLFGLGFAFALGFGAADSLAGLLDVPYLRSGFVFVVMWVTGVTLPAEAIRRTVTNPMPSIIATLLNIFAVPALCYVAWYALPPTLGAGLYVAGLVPCTLASAAIWTRKAGGDDSVALLTTVITNLACVAVVPIGLWIGMGRTSQIPIADQVSKLLVIIVIPMSIAQACRRFGMAGWATKNRRTLSQIAQVGILVMVFFGAIASRNLLPTLDDPAEILRGTLGLGMLALCCVLVHCWVLWMGIRIGRSLGIDRGRQIAIGFAGSQKTLMVGLQIAIDCGVSVVPMILYHLVQLMIDTWVAQKWQRYGN